MMSITTTVCMAAFLSCAATVALLYEIAYPRSRFTSFGALGTLLLLGVFLLTSTTLSLSEPGHTDRGTALLLSDVGYFAGVVVGFIPTSVLIIADRYTGRKTGFSRR